LCHTSRPSLVQGEHPGPPIKARVRARIIGLRLFVALETLAEDRPRRLLRLLRVRVRVRVKVRVSVKVRFKVRVRGLGSSRLLLNIPD